MSRSVYEDETFNGVYCIFSCVVTLVYSILSVFSTLITLEIQSTLIDSSVNMMVNADIVSIFVLLLLQILMSVNARQTTAL